MHYADHYILTAFSLIQAAILLFIFYFLLRYTLLGGDFVYKRATFILKMILKYGSSMSSHLMNILIFFKSKVWFELGEFPVNYTYLYRTLSYFVK